MYPEREFLVTMTGQGVSCRRPDGSVESVTWDDLQAVILETNDGGPLSLDVFWILVGKTSGCLVPQVASGERELFHRLQALPGFDNQMVIQAMSSNSNQRFLCWERSPDKNLV